MAVTDARRARPGAAHRIAAPPGLSGGAARARPRSRRRGFRRSRSGRTPRPWRQSPPPKPSRGRC
ncbi:MAG: hypothetical protein COY86_04720 [Rhodobacterales bacterium CG_4_10_14_0_8_um_filter_70_9]|nr:MAG: hypothetical protein COY86_04720 [Rhodobacterales bacterium CG_4_10_14_0_8_um_filter_70_9]